MSRTPHRRTAFAAISLATISLSTLAACGDDADAMSAAACDAYTDLQAAMFGDPAALTPAVEALATALPESLEQDGTAIAAIAADPAALEDPAVNTSLQSIGDAAYSDCDVDEQLDVSGVDYAFEDLPKQIDAGRVAIRFTNNSEGNEPHELVLATAAEGQNVGELATLPLDELFAQARPLAVAFTDTPEQHATALVDLEPGEYLVICTLPVGGFGDSATDGPPADPHSAHGMVTTLTVL